MKKWLVVLLCVFLMFSGLTACSKEEDNKEGENNSEVVIRGKHIK